MIIALPENMSQEKCDVLKALGAEVIRTTVLPFEHKNNHFGTCERLAEELDNAHMLNQYKNPSNPISHYEETGE